MGYRSMGIMELEKELAEYIEYWDSLESSRDALYSELGQDEDNDEDIQVEIDDIQDEMNNIEDTIFDIQIFLEEKAE